MNADIDRVREIFIQALRAAPPGQREAFLRETCGGDADLYRQVKALLHAHEQAGSFLDRPALGEPAAGEGQTRALEPPAPAPPAEGPGALVGPYKLLEPIGEGGFGVVFLAEQQHPVRRQVALKVIKPGMDTRHVIARFEAERQALALMDHPNIAHVLDAGSTASGRPYFVMELVRGIPITDYCDRCHLTTAERLGLFLSVCSAIQHAHQKGVLHRDLKPSNVLVAVPDGRPVVKVIDFGLAKALGQRLTDRTLQTGFHQMVGTPLYMSPEQAEMGPLDVDTRTDVYALGVLLYELLTGTTPFARERLHEAGYDEIRRIICEEEPPRPSIRLTTLGERAATAAEQRRTDPRKLRQSLRGDLDWIVMKCLDKDRTRRYETASSLAADVRRHLDHEPVSAGPPSTLYRFGKFARRYRAPLAAASAVTLALLLGTAVSTWQAIRAGLAEGLAEQRLTVAQNEGDRALRASREARHRLFEARLAQARASRRGRQVGQRSESWLALREAAGLARALGLGEDRLQEVRDEAIASLALTDVRTLKKWEGWPPGSAAGLAFDPDLRHYARSDLQGTVSVHRVADDRKLVRLPRQGTRGAAILKFSPDGALLAVRWWEALPGLPTNFQLWDWRNDRVLLEPPHPVHWSALAFSPDGKRLALGRRDGAVAVYETATGKEQASVDAGFPASHLAFTPDGGRLAVASARDGEIKVHDLATGAVAASFTAPARARYLAWHPDGVLLAAGCEDYNAYLLDPAGHRPHTVLQGHRGFVMGVAFSPDGDLLLSHGWDGTCRLWDPWTGLERVRFAGGAPQFSRDGRRLACRAGHDLVLREVIPGREYHTLPWRLAGKGEVRGGDLSPDGRWLAVVTRAGLRLWDLPARKEIGFLPLPGTVGVKFHPRKPELFTSGPSGLYRWPLTRDGAVLRIGPAGKLAVPGSLGQMSLDRQGRTLAVTRDRGGAWVLDPEDPARKPARLDHPNGTSVAVSPDGRWVATGAAHGPGVKVWRADGALERELTTEQDNAAVAFCPSGRWLAVLKETAVEVRAVGSWQVARRVPREQPPDLSAAFAPDGRVLAFTPAHSVVALTDPASGLPVARLPGPDADLVSPLGFSPDGSQLVVATRAGDVHVWDLRRIRARLGELGLAGDLPPYPAATPAGAGPARVEADLGEFVRGVEAQKLFERGRDHLRAGRGREALADFSRVIELQPDHAHTWHERGQAHRELGEWEHSLADLEQAVRLAGDDPRLLNNLAWALATSPEMRLRDVARALPLAGRAVQSAPNVGAFWNTLGVARYRAGDWQGALEALEQSRRLQQGGGGWDFFFLALTHRQLGRESEARTWHDRGVGWMAKNAPRDEELLRFRAEAERQLGIAGLKD